MLIIMIYPQLIIAEKSQAEYPAWFLEVPFSYGSEYSIGFCQPCLNSDSSATIARTNAVWSLVKQSRLLVTTEAGIARNNTEVFHGGEDTKLTIDSTLLENYYDASTIIEKFYYGNMLIVLVGPSDKIPPQGKDENSYGDWTLELPADDSYYYSMGIAPEYYYETSSWIEAENIAVTDMAKQISVDIKALGKYYDSDVYQISSEKGSAVLRNWGIAARKYDEDKKTYYVLIKMGKVQ